MCPNLYNLEFGLNDIKTSQTDHPDCVCVCGGGGGGGRKTSLTVPKTLNMFDILLTFADLLNFTSQHISSAKCRMFILGDS